MKHFKNWLSFEPVAEISAQALREMMAKPVVQCIDVRSGFEWRSSRIEGAINLPIHRFNEARVGRLGFDKDLPVIVICLSAHRSMPAVRLLHSMGFQRAMQLKGGMQQWWKSKYPTVSGYTS